MNPTGFTQSINRVKRASLGHGESDDSLFFCLYGARWADTMAVPGMRHEGEAPSAEAGVKNLSPYSVDNLVGKPGRRRVTPVVRLTVLRNVAAGVP